MLDELNRDSTVLVVSAHPDDAEIGMGGTIAKLIGKGMRVISVVLTDGRRSPNPGHTPIDTLIHMRMEEARSAANVLHITNVLFFGLEDLQEVANIRRASKQFKSVLEAHSPAAVFALHPQLDRHATHRKSGELVRNAVPSSLPLWAYEVWGLFPRWDAFEDISDQMEAKIASIREHKSQIAIIPYDAGVRGLNRWRAVFADPAEQQPACTYAEVFLRL
jgi:LmbE family N-acetylglucosaminyl deacetylase